MKNFQGNSAAPQMRRAVNLPLPGQSAQTQGNRVAQPAPKKKKRYADKLIQPKASFEKVVPTSIAQFRENVLNLFR